MTAANPPEPGRGKGDKPRPLATEAQCAAIRGLAGELLDKPGFLIQPTSIQSMLEMTLGLNCPNGILDRGTASYAIEQLNKRLRVGKWT